MTKKLIAGALSCPLVWMGWLILQDIQVPGSALGADAGETLVQYFGTWTLNALLVTFSVSPLCRLTGFAPLAGSRRMTGLFAFAYLCIHLLCYLALYLGFDLRSLFNDFRERPYITAGMIAFCCLLLMTLTSTKGWQRRLRRNWRRLHRLVYVVVGAGLIHLWWLTKDGFSEVVLYTLCFVILTAERMCVVLKKADSG